MIQKHKYEFTRPVKVATFKVREQIDASSYTTHVFVGKVTDECKRVLDRATSSLSTKDERLLRETFGPGFRNALCLSDASVHFVHEHIYIDDTLTALQNKIKTFLGASWCYMWCRTALLPSSIQMNRVVADVMRGQPHMFYADIVNALTCLFGDPSVTKKGFDPNQTYNATSLLATIASANKRLILIQAMGHTLSNGSHSVLFNGDPFNADDEMTRLAREDMDVLERKFDHSKTVGYYAPLDHMIHVVTNRKSVPKLYRAFPCNSYALDTSAQGGNEVMAEYLSSPDIPPTPDLFVNYLHLRTNENMRIHDHNLDRCFEEVELGVSCPFARLHKDARTLFKIHKPTFSDPKFDPKTVEQWFQTAMSEFMGPSTLTHEHLVLKFHCSSLGADRFFTFVLHNNLSYEVKFAFRREDAVQQDMVDEHIRTVNVKLRSLRKLLGVSMHELPDIDPKFWVNNHYMTNTRIHKIITTTHIDETPTLQEVKKLALKLFPLLSVIEPKGTRKDVLHLVYKRVDEFANDDAIRAFIDRTRANSTNASRAELITHMTHYFDMSHAEAVIKYDNLASGPGVANKGRFNPSFFVRKHVSIKVKESETRGLVVLVDGCSTPRIDFQILTTIQALVRFLVASTHQKFHAIGRDKNAQVAHVDPSSPMAADPVSGSPSPSSQTQDVEFDEEFHNMLLGLADKADPENQAEYANTEDGGDDAYAPHRYMLTKLYQVDRKLFDTKDKVYSKTCQLASGRQPVGITDDEKAYMEKNHSGAINGSIKYGSDPSKPLNYICPRMWCPRTRIAITEAEYIAAGRKCPAKRTGDTLVEIGEQPIVQDSESYWGPGNGKARYPGFLSPTKHPDGLCMPCCFATAHQKWKKCIPGVEEGDKKKTRRKKDAGKEKEKSESVAAPDAARGNTKYIMDYDRNPTEAGRFSLLPQGLHKFLDNSACGHRSSGSGLITVNTTKCFLKRGLPETPRGLFECLAHVLGNKKIPNASELVRLVSTHMSALDFVSLNGGALAREFAPDDADPRDHVMFSLFKDWAAENEAYFDKMAMSELFNHIADLKAFQPPEKDPLSAQVLREFVVYSAHANFVKYLHDKEAKHDERLFIDLVNLKRSWLNVSGVNVVFLRADDAENAYCLLPTFRPISEVYPMARDWVFVLRFGRTFEPLYMVSSKTMSDFEMLHHFSTETQTAAQKLIRLVRPVNDTSSGHDLRAVLKGLGYVEERIAVSPDFRVVGFVVRKDDEGTLMFAPYPNTEAWDSMLNYRSRASPGFVHVQDLYALEEWRTRLAPKPKEYKELFRALEKHYKTGDYVLSSNDGALRLACGVQLPPMDVEDSEYLRRLTDDANLFVGLTTPDARVVYMNDMETAARMYLAFRNESLHHIRLNAGLQSEVYYARHPRNPYPKAFRRKRLRSALNGLRSLVKPDDNDEGPTAFTNNVCASIAKKNWCEASGHCAFDGKCRLRVPKNKFDLLLDKLIDELMVLTDQHIKPVVGYKQPSNVVVLTQLDLLAANNNVQVLLTRIRQTFSLDDEWAT